MIEDLSSVDGHRERRLQDLANSMGGGQFHPMLAITGRSEHILNLQLKPKRG